MRLGMRKLIILILVGSIFLLANVWFVVKWLEDAGVVEFAKYVKTEYLTGTAITIILTLLILLVKPGKEALAGSGFFRRCPVCDGRMVGKSYCQMLCIKVFDQAAISLIPSVNFTP